MSWLLWLKWLFERKRLRRLLRQWILYKCQSICLNIWGHMSYILDRCCLCATHGMGTTIDRNIFVFATWLIIYIFARDLRMMTVHICVSHSVYHPTKLLSITWTSTCDKNLEFPELAASAVLHLEKDILFTKWGDALPEFSPISFNLAAPRLHKI